MRSLGLALAVALVLAPALEAQTTISAPGGDEVRSWGKPNSQTYGQTVTSPGNVLNSFSFWLGRTSPLSADPAPDLDFRAYVYAWDSGSSRATGSALFTSAIMNHTATEASAFTRYDVNTGGVALTPGAVYALFFSTSGLTGSGQVFWEAATAEAYAGGNYIFQNNGEDMSQWTTTSWGSGLVADLRFEATFDRVAAVPEPASVMLLGLGLIGVCGVAVRRKLYRFEA